jgi:hypothetical protein
MKTVENNNEMLKLRHENLNKINKILNNIQALIKYFSSWQQSSQTKNFLPIFFINMNFGCNSN